MISIQVKGAKRLLKSVENLGSRSHRRELLDQIGSYGVSSTQQRFLDQKAPDGQAWTKSARAESEGGQTLRQSNVLFQSLTHNASPDHTEWGTNIIYAAIHQFGGVIKPKSKKSLAFFVGGALIMAKQVTIPARPYLGVDNADETEIEAIVGDWVQETMQ